MSPVSQPRSMTRSPATASSVGSPTTFLGVIPPLPTARRDGTKRVDTATIPRPRYNVESDRFVVHTAAHSVPPPTYQHFTVIDDGNCNPRFMRSTMYKVGMRPAAAAAAAAG